MLSNYTFKIKPHASRVSKCQEQTDVCLHTIFFYIFFLVSIFLAIWGAFLVVLPQFFVQNGWNWNFVRAKTTKFSMSAWSCQYNWISWQIAKKKHMIKFKYKKFSLHLVRDYGPRCAGRGIFFKNCEWHYFWPYYHNKLKHFSWDTQLLISDHHILCSFTAQGIFPL